MVLMKQYGIVRLENTQKQNCNSLMMTQLKSLFILLLMRLKKMDYANKELGDSPESVYIHI